jgi:hypothetical protein
MKSSNPELKMHCANAVFKVIFKYFENNIVNVIILQMLYFSVLKIRKLEIWYENMVV